MKADIDTALGAHRPDVDRRRRPLGALRQRRGAQRERVDERRPGPDPHAGRRGRDDLLHEPGHVGDALRRRARLGARDARGARAVRGRGHRRRRRLRAHGRQAGRDAAAPRRRASATGSRTCTTRARARCRSSTSSATTRPTTRSTTRSCSRTSRRSRATCPSWVRTSQSTEDLGRRRRRGDRRRDGPARPGRHADPARRRVVGATAREPAAAAALAGARRSPPSDVVDEVAKALRGRGDAALLLGGRALREPGLVAAARIAAATGAKRARRGLPDPPRARRGAAAGRAARLPRRAGVGPARRASSTWSWSTRRRRSRSSPTPARRATWCPTAARCTSSRRPTQDAVGSLEALAEALGADGAAPRAAGRVAARRARRAS